jgi:hypothetical protein
VWVHWVVFPGACQSIIASLSVPLVMPRSFIVWLEPYCVLAMLSRYFFTSAGERVECSTPRASQVGMSHLPSSS